MKEVKILGAGLSGLTAAITLKKAGYEVKIYEKNKDVGMRFNGDIQGIENWSEDQEVIDEIKNEIGLKINFDFEPIKKIVLSDTKEHSTVRHKTPFFYLIKRGSKKGTIDYGLKEQAIKLGVKICFEKTISKEKADIVATGPIKRKIVGIDKGIVFDSKSKDVAEMVLNEDLAFDGYSYLFITKGKGCLCTVVMNSPEKVGNCYEKTEEYFRKKYKLDIKNKKNAGGIGSFSIEQRYEKIKKNKKILYVGESAGLQDVLWGFGMRFAINSGYLAAKSIIENKSYKKLANRAFKKKIKASIVNRYFWEKSNVKAFKFFIKHPKYSSKELYVVHRYVFFQRLFYLLAKRYLKKKYKNV